MEPNLGKKNGGAKPWKNKTSTIAFGFRGRDSWTPMQIVPELPNETLKSELRNPKRRAQTTKPQTSKAQTPNPCTLPNLYTPNPYTPNSTPQTLHAKALCQKLYTPNPFTLNPDPYPRFKLVEGHVLAGH